MAVMSGDFVQRGRLRRSSINICAPGWPFFPGRTWCWSASLRVGGQCRGFRLLRRLHGRQDRSGGFLSFGSESGDLKLLERQAALYEAETPEVSARIREGLKRGFPGQGPREQAFLHTNAPVPVSPNDILACEYLRAIKSHGSSMLPGPVERNDGGYHSSGRKGSFASATAIRKALAENDLDFLTQVVPEAFFSCLKLESCPQVTADDFSMILNEKLLTLPLSGLTGISGMPEDLARKLHKNRLSFASLSERTASSKDRASIPYARVSRCLLNTVLGITREETERFKALDSAPWLRILGFRKDALPLLSEIKKHSAVPMITKTAHAAALLSGPSLELFYKHLQCAELYRLAAELKTGRPMKNEFTRSPVII